MKRLHFIPSETRMDAYRSTLTGEHLGWVVFSTSASFTPAHRILVDPEAGPVIIIVDEVYEVSLEADIYLTEDEARDAYWAGKVAAETMPTIDDETGPKGAAEISSNEVDPARDIG